jgi:hypothetical protein
MDAAARFTYRVHPFCGHTFILVADVGTCVDS